jgi:hypothetical protein
LGFRDGPFRDALAELREYFDARLVLAAVGGVAGGGHLGRHASVDPR